MAKEEREAGVTGKVLSDFAGKNLWVTSSCFMASQLLRGGNALSYNVVFDVMFYMIIILY